MFSSQRIGLYWRTTRYLKPEQLWRRIAFKLFPPSVSRNALPGCGKAIELRTRFPDGYRGLTGAGRFRFLNDERVFPGWNDPACNKLWLYNLHYFDLLRQAGLTEDDGRRWIAKWIAENPPFSGNGWEPYPISLRIVNWIKWAVSGHSLDGAASASLALQARFLSRRTERHLLANHLLANAKALVFAGCFFTGPEAAKWLDTGLAIYREQLPEQILADGGHFERSPMYHSIILEDLLDLLNIGAPLELGDTVRHMLDWLAVLTGPDGRIAHLNDAADGIALTPEALFKYGEELGFSRPGRVTACRDLPQTGYARLTDGEWTLICDGAPIGPDYQPGHAHADTLTFELWHGTTRLVVDSGTGEYIDTPLRREQRGTAGHNTLTVDGANSSEVWGAHRVAARARIVERRFSDSSFSAAHDGFRRMTHRREWRISAAGVHIRDRIGGSGVHTVDMYWHLSPSAEVESLDGRVAWRSEGKRFVLMLPAAVEHAIETGHCSPEFGKSLSHPVVHCRHRGKLPFEAETTINMEQDI